MPHPRDILDAPGPLPGEKLEADEYADDTDPNVLRAETEHPGLDFSAALWDDTIDAVVIPRAELEKVETPLRWEVRSEHSHLYVLAYHDGGVTLAAREPGPMFEGAYIASPTSRRHRSAL